MKNIALVTIVVASIFLFSCKKDSTQQSCQYTPSTIVVPVSEQQALQDSLTAHNIGAIKDTAGFFYTINEPGSVSGMADLCSSIAVYYKGAFFDGQSF